MSRYNRERQNRERMEAMRYEGERQRMGRDFGQDINRDMGRNYGQRYRTSDRMNQGREYDSRQAEDWDRYGMQSDDWRHMDNYWENTYGDRYPRRRDETFGGLGGPTDWMSTKNPNHAGKGPRNYKRSDDRILEDVNEQLTRHPMIDATDIEVTVTEGEVVLRGTVDRRETKRMAEDVAENVSGVKNVRNEIRVQDQQARKDKGGRAA